MILKEGDIFQKGDEMQSPITGKWSVISEKWIGGKLSYHDNNTVSRFKVAFRRPQKNKDVSKSTPNSPNAESK